MKRTSDIGFRQNRSPVRGLPVVFIVQALNIDLPHQWKGLHNARISYIARNALHFHYEILISKIVVSGNISKYVYIAFVAQSIMNF